MSLLRKVSESRRIVTFTQNGDYSHFLTLFVTLSASLSLGRGSEQELLFLQPGINPRVRITRNPASGPGQTHRRRASIQACSFGFWTKVTKVTKVVIIPRVVLRTFLYPGEYSGQGSLAP